MDNLGGGGGGGELQLDIPAFPPLYETQLSDAIPHWESGVCLLSLDLSLHYFRALELSLHCLLLDGD